MRDLLLSNKPGYGSPVLSSHTLLLRNAPCLPSRRCSSSGHPAPYHIEDESLFPALISPVAPPRVQLTEILKNRGSISNGGWQEDSRLALITSLLQVQAVSEQER